MTMTRKARIDAAFQAATRGSEQVIVAAMVTTLRGPVAVHIFTADCGQHRAGDWEVNPYTYGESRTLTDAEVESMLAAATNIEAGVRRINNSGGISFGWVLTTGTADAMRYAHRVDSRYANEGQSVHVTYDTFDAALADAMRCAEADPLWGRPALSSTPSHPEEALEYGR